MFSKGKMICDSCGVTQESHPTIESGWYLMVVDKSKKYLCPLCMNPNDLPCPKCGNFYHEKYNKCPFCKAKGGFSK